MITFFIKVNSLVFVNETCYLLLQFFITGEDYPDLDREVAFAETVLESILSDSIRKDAKQKPFTPTNLKPSILRRNRSGSGQEKQVTLDANVIVQQEDGCENYEKSAKVSKWTRVKAAFR